MKAEAPVTGKDQTTLMNLAAEAITADPGHHSTI
jgi:hypothetical protein